MQKRSLHIKLSLLCYRAMCFLEYRSSEDTTVGTVHMDSVTEDKQLRGKDKECIVRGQR